MIDFRLSSYLYFYVCVCARVCVSVPDGVTIVDLFVSNADDAGDRTEDIR